MPPRPRHRFVPRLGAALLLGAVGIVAAVHLGAIDLPFLATIGVPPLVACTAAPPFSRSPVEPSALSAIVPLGRVVPPAHVFPTAQLNLYLAREPATHAIRPAPLVAPGDLRVVRVGRHEVYDRRDPKQRAPVATDYTIDFEVCSEVTGYFMLVQSLDADLARRVGDFPPLGCERHETGDVRMRSCSKRVAIDLAAGTPLGTVGRVVPPGAAWSVAAHGADLFDWGLRDARVVSPHPFSNPSRPQDRDLAHAACPLDYLEPVARAALDAAIMPAGTAARPGARCGTPFCDVPGTAAGRWFLARHADRPEDDHLALLDDPVDAERGLFSVGNGLRPAVAPQPIGFAHAAGGAANATGPVNQPFGATRAPAVACYEGLEGSGPEPFHGVIRLRLPDAEHLDLEAFPGARRCADLDGPGAPAATIAHYLR